jgi:hypothetical protein
MGDPIIRRAVAACGVAAALTAAVVGCSSNDNSSSSASSSAATSAAQSAATSASASAAAPADATTKAVTDVFTEFFAGSTPADKKASLLENGAQFADAIKAQANNPMAKSTSASVSQVKVTDPQHANVTYTIEMGGNPVLPNQAGSAVQQDGAWKVSDATFCTLLKLQGGAPPACNSVH